MRTFLFLASLVCLSWARTLLVQTKDEATTTTKPVSPVAQIDELFEPPISIYSEYEDQALGYEHLYEDSDHAPEEPSNGKSSKEGKGANRKNRKWKMENKMVGLKWFKMG